MDPELCAPLIPPPPPPQADPPKEWMEALLLAAMDQELVGFGPQELSNTVW